MSGRTELGTRDARRMSEEERRTVLSEFARLSEASAVKERKEELKAKAIETIEAMRAQAGAVELQDQVQEAGSSHPPSYTG